MRLRTCRVLEELTDIIRTEDHRQFGRSAHAWELLIAMLAMEAAFGVPGLVAAPIYYAYLKDELVSQRQI